MSAAETLLRRIVDYAGLFPPAALPMEVAVRNYQKYLDGDESFILGSFVVPAARFDAFSAAFEASCCDEQEAPWTISIVCAGETAQDVAAIEEFQQGAVFIGSLEAKASDARAARETLERLPAARSRYVEFPPEKAADILPVLSEYGARAKIRMGGVTTESVPSPETVARFLNACAREQVAWKATAGLHHAVRGIRELQPGGPRAPMHGFVNLFLAGAIAFFGASEAALLRTLKEEHPAAFRAEDELIRWHDNTLTTDQLEQVRSGFAISFGSCSFAEPIDDAKAMGWL